MEVIWGVIIGEDACSEFPEVIEVGMELGFGLAVKGGDACSFLEEKLSGGGAGSAEADDEDIFTFYIQRFLICDLRFKIFVSGLFLSFPRSSVGMSMTFYFRLFDFKTIFIGL